MQRVSHQFILLRF